MAGRKSLLFEGDVIRWEVVLSQTAPRRLPAFSAVLCDVHNFVFKNEKIRPVLARQPDHILIVIFDPAVNDFAVGQFDPDRFLFLPQRLQIRGLLRGLLGRSALGFPGSGGTCLSVECHTSILHAATGGRWGWSKDRNQSLIAVDRGSIRQSFPRRFRHENLNSRVCVSSFRGRSFCAGSDSSQRTGAGWQSRERVRENRSSSDSPAPFAGFRKS